MKKKVITKAVMVINRKIKLYQVKLTHQLELKAEMQLGNCNLKTTSFDDNCIRKYETILADLATIKRAIKNHQEAVDILGTAENRNCIYDETLQALYEAGFKPDVDEYEEGIYLTSIYE